MKDFWYGLTLFLSVLCIIFLAIYSFKLGYDAGVMETTMKFFKLLGIKSAST